MRITKLAIKKYKNLENFSWNLNPDYPVAVIVGKNASGKTNLLEAIITIFQDLQLYNEASRQNELPEFEFEIEYLRKDDKINIENNGSLEITKNDEKVSLGQLQTLHQDISQGEGILPRNIFVYYAGNTTRLQQLAGKSISEYKKLLIDIANNKVERQSSPSQPLFYYDLNHHRVVFLTLLLSSLEGIQIRFLKDDLNIEELASVNLTISRPDWKRTSADWKRISTDTESFWDAPVYLKRILAIIRETASLEVSKESGEIKFEISGNNFREKFAETSVERDFFQQLSNLVLAEYLTDIKIYFRKKTIQEKTLEFSDLSEGEWQRIAIRGAMEIFQGEDVLFLLDEPDTFAHPRWQWDFVPDLKEAIDSKEKNIQAIFITHSPLVLSSVEKNAFFMEAGKIEPMRDNFGQDANMSLINMGVNPQYEEVDIDFQNYFDLIKSGKGETEEALVERARLEEIYGLNHERFDSADILISFYR